MLDRDEGARTRGRGPSARVGEEAPVPRAWAVAAWVMCGLVWSLGLATIGLAVAGRVPPPRFVTSFMALGPLFAMPAALLGARIVQQRRGNRLGWILLAMGLTQAIAQTANAYAWLSVNRHGGGLLGTALATWVCSFAWMPNFALGPYLLLLFPNGRLPGRRWRPAAWAGGAVMAALIAAFAVLAWSVRGITLYQNTLGTVALAPLDALEGLLYVVGDALIVVAAVALLMRLRRLRGAERQQTKWFAFGAIPWVAVDLTWVAVQLTGGDVPALAAGLGSLVALSGLLGVIAVAVFRYQLYDIDRLLNRTLVYALVTAILGSGYAALVLVLGQLLGRDRSSLGVAVATLAAAGLFQPLRRRVQQAVDRRFDRRRYDGARTIERFSGHLREEVDLDMLSGELLRVVDQTMQPTTVWLWLRPRVGVTGFEPVASAV
jgi:hypothetical protein